MNLWLLCLSLTSMELAEPPQVVFRAASEFRTAVSTPLTASWDNVPLRDLLRSVSTNQRVSILLDRRLDPTTTVRLALREQSLIDGVQELAAHLDSDLALPGNVVYVGPATSARWLRTAIAQREAELTDGVLPVSERRQIALWNRKTMLWSPLDSPREIVDRIAQRYELTVTNPERIPHDLWAGGALPHATAAEALLCVLIQYDLDFRWEDGGNAIQLVDFAVPELIERRYPARKPLSVAETWAAWQRDFPDLKGRVQGDEIVVAGRVEDHDRLTAKPSGRDVRPATAGDPVPLRRRKWTLRAENVPIVSVMRELEKAGVQFVFDPAELQKAGVDLQTLVSLNLQQASADDFLKQLFAPLSVTFDINDRQVTLKVSR